MDVTAQFHQLAARLSAARLSDAQARDDGSAAARSTRIAAPQSGPQLLKDAYNARQAYAETRARLAAVEAFVARTRAAYTAVAPLRWSEVRRGLSDGERDAIDDQLARMVS
jgi:hypothetical protein